MEKVIEIDFSLARKNRDSSDKPVLEEKVGGCLHYGSYLVDSKAEFVTCKQCGERLNPIWVLGQLARNESRYRNQVANHRKVSKELEGRNRTKCQHCGQMTRIIK